MSQDGQGYGTGEQPGPPSWRPQDAGAWPAPTEPQATGWAGGPTEPQGAPWGAPAPAQPGASWAGAPAGAFAHPGYVPPGQAPRTPAIAVVGLVLAIIMAPVGLVVSLVALGRTRRAGAGRGLAVAGSIVGAALTVVGIGVAVALVPLIGQVAGPRTSVLRLDAAVESSSCDDFMATSTRAFRASNGLATCDDFTAFVASSGYEDNQVQVTGVRVENGVATVSTVETYLWLDDGQTYTDRFVYRVVKEDGAWRVDGIDLVGQ